MTTFNWFEIGWHIHRAADYGTISVILQITWPLKGHGCGWRVRVREAGNGRATSARRGRYRLQCMAPLSLFVLAWLYLYNRTCMWKLCDVVFIKGLHIMLFSGRKLYQCINVIIGPVGMPHTICRATDTGTGSCDLPYIAVCTPFGGAPYRAPHLLLLLSSLLWEKILTC